MTEHQLWAINKFKGISVKEFNFGETVNTRIQNVFLCHGIKTLGDVLNITIQDFAIYNGFGTKSHKAICDMMTKLITHAPDFRETKLTEVDFHYMNTRVQAYFRSLGLKTVREVITYPMHDLIKNKGFGMRSLTCVRMVFDENGYWGYNGKV